MLPMRTDPDRVHNYLVPGSYTIRLLSICHSLVFYTYNKDNEVRLRSYLLMFFAHFVYCAMLCCATHT